MAEEQFDAIIVGGGIAGLSAGYLLAERGLDVLLIERGNYCGAKNMTGGRIYAYALEKLGAGFAKDAPFERRILREKVSMLTKESSVALDFFSEALGEAGSDSYSVLRGPFDQWLQSRAEEAGVSVITGVRVDDLLVSGGQVKGVVAGGETMEARVTILADGVNSLLAQKLGLCRKLDAKHVSVGAKEVIALPEETVSERFQCGEGEGAAWLFAGLPSGGCVGGGFLYTNRASVSLGIVCNVADVCNGGKPVPELLEDFKAHGAIAPLLKGGKSIEYSGHMVPEGGLDMAPDLVGDGVLVVGDAAGFCLNLGYAVRGMDLAVLSAECAARAVLKAKEKNDFTQGALMVYKDFLEESVLMKDMRLYQKLPHFMETTPGLYGDYPRLAEAVLLEMFRMDGAPGKPVRQKLLPHLKKAGFLRLLTDAWRGGRCM